jgi:hypothetical protein
MASRLLQELKRRKVVQVAIVYAVVGFGVTQVAPYGLALILLSVGDVDGALDQLERGLHERTVNLPFIGQTDSPTWRPLYDHHRFQAV